MRNALNILTGAALGSGLMFFLDPQAGGRRRALTRDKAVKWSRSTGRALTTTGKHVEAGWRKTSAGTRSAVEAATRLIGRAGPVDDRVLAERMRACIGRHSSHPGAIDVVVQSGCVTFRGTVLASEVDEVLRCGSSLNGVMAVDNQLQVHETPGHVPALQGAPARRSLRGRWEASPRFRLAAGIAAGLGIGALALRGTR
jgi:hypothetical protein